MEILLLRHGRAGRWNPLRFPDDSLRPLTEAGEARLTGQARGMAVLGLSPDLVISSPLLRALQTAQIFHAGLNCVRPILTSQALVPEADPIEIVEELIAEHRSLASVMLVGHEPHMSSLVSSLVSGVYGSRESVIRMRKGGLCMIRLEISGDGVSGRIEWSLTARQMLAMA